MTSDSGKVQAGLNIPGNKYYETLSEDRSEPNAYKFNQYAPVYDEKQASGGWGQYFAAHSVPESSLPQ